MELNSENVNDDDNESESPEIGKKIRMYTLKKYPLISSQQEESFNCITKCCNCNRLLMSCESISHENSCSRMSDISLKLESSDELIRINNDLHSLCSAVRQYMGSAQLKKRYMIMICEASNLNAIKDTSTMRLISMRSEIIVLSS